MTNNAIKIIEGQTRFFYLCFCLRCRMEWVSRQARPRICPYCKSAHWDLPRKHPKRTPTQVTARAVQGVAIVDSSIKPVVKFVDKLKAQLDE